MKKIYGTMFVAALCSSASLFAQDAPDKKYFLGGTVGAFTRKVEDVQNVGGTPIGNTTKSNGVSIYPEFGFYIKKNTALGIKLGYSRSKSAGTDEYIYNSYRFAPFVRYLVPLWNSRFTIYNDLGVSAGLSKGEGDSPTGNISKSTQLGAFYEPGLQFRLKNNISLLASMGNFLTYDYSRSRITSKQDPVYKTTTTDHTLGISSNFLSLDNFRIGANLLF